MFVYMIEKKYTLFEQFRFYPFIQYFVIEVYYLMKAPKTGLIVSYTDYEPKTKKKLLVVQKIATYAKHTKHCEISTYGWFIVSSLARRLSGDDSFVFSMQWYSIMLSIVLCINWFFVHEEISQIGIDFSVRANVKEK